MRRNHTSTDGGGLGFGGFAAMVVSTKDCTRLVLRISHIQPLKILNLRSPQADMEAEMVPLTLASLDPKP